MHLIFFTLLKVIPLHTKLPEQIEHYTESHIGNFRMEWRPLSKMLSILWFLEKLFIDIKFWLYQNIRAWSHQPYTWHLPCLLIWTHVFYHLQLPTHHHHLDLGMQRKVENLKPFNNMQGNALLQTNKEIFKQAWG